MASCCKDLTKATNCEDEKEGRVGNPPLARSTKVRCCISTDFRKFYHRGDLPVRVINSRKILWTVPIESLDYDFYLPLFFDGLVELEHPFELLAYLGAYEMIENTNGCKVNPVLSRLILPMKNALCTRNCRVIMKVLKLIQVMIVKESEIGISLVPYYRHLLGILNIFKNKNVTTGDLIEFGHRDNLGDLINETLEMMERCGGDNAFINIKYMIPTYESCFYCSRR
ncbi:hypothetical protein HELRODRAFT_165883 [Helobdella robusta]|uniref:Parkin coregulated gene protein homolog n=1 Tax=Helobdella robusta TaxID=6412 RepID=T1EXE5_HELRO|nr:hypothetical protein HELRODRAFT_165883 [Helobdella robusta]ESN91804.1 hypothetical protein HELRODRAFT_165883 [Helobdella robusta]